MLKIGIECENLEDAKSRWGVGHVVLNLLKEYEKNIEWHKEFKLYLYFNQFIPDDEVLKNPIFVKRIVGWKSLKSFNIFYHILMPVKAMLDGVDRMFFPAYMMPPLYLGKAVVILTNDVYYEYKQGTLPFKYRLAYGMFTNWAAKFAYKIMAISGASKDEVARLYKIKPNKIFVSRLGSHRAREVAQDFKSNSLYILYVGQMFARRHAKETILAFSQIAPKYPDLRLILVGRDKYPRPIIQSMVKEMNNRFGRERINYRDYVADDEISRLYSSAELVVYVSESEAFGLPPVEAASYGVPVVVMDNALNHELFNDAAFFAANGTSEKIADAIDRGLKDEQKRKYCKDRYKELIPRLSWSSFAKSFFENVK
ncbi:MAG: hypothetical protein A2568_01830 [Candidatus Yanofskybacteria bacterium RIFOXYD1_FULL_44_17]|uniref:Glycosyl transferase family 1 domain-containing protein n=1 Tax=Candidatus Yanofskybacteria bacterium GW2011_GWE2_40_11 TaxID=1619033 RepID=A0A0G0T274_9BACT|nr:MAG: hypothetical protein UT75_C0001G0094 [Candidatus Yanofskybacteria bacterium GW2011_GWE2_40_11]OGN36207.1 MAG: hypothetical protein A2241_00465 [Candidatus Yanofskybacteria bacterium RIFOXYA2_FULL_45_28]OGN36923.1 MAG: hypothetical protein A2207_01115 [Candidatus Yanofskybacteria bacterium RIFOXYA1_FULL_44_17]OGN38366.1 MAG: hypothetical protein A2405_01385 [Candidatus Yanofskybacteria bacterium RIFOXYC1_FULL_44_16]OGN38544.1 MAG: hypothetical protein A2302_00510 [Candidatus Yanofskybact